MQIRGPSRHLRTYLKIVCCIWHALSIPTEINYNRLCWFLNIIYYYFLYATPSCIAITFLPLVLLLWHLLLEALLPDGLRHLAFRNDYSHLGTLRPFRNIRKYIQTWSSSFIKIIKKNSPYKQFIHLVITCMQAFTFSAILKKIIWRIETYYLKMILHFSYSLHIRNCEINVV